MIFASQNLVTIGHAYHRINKRRLLNFLTGSFLFHGIEYTEWTNFKFSWKNFDWMIINYSSFYWYIFQHTITITISCALKLTLHTSQLWLLRDSSSCKSKRWEMQHILFKLDIISIISAVAKTYEMVLQHRLLTVQSFGFNTMNMDFSSRKVGIQTAKIMKAISLTYNSLHKRKIIMALFLHLGKAFDVVVHSVVIKKLQQFGIALSDMSNRQQYRVMANTPSDKFVIVSH